MSLSAQRSVSLINSSTLLIVSCNLFLDSSLSCFKTSSLALSIAAAKVWFNCFNSSVLAVFNLLLALLRICSSSDLIFGYLSKVANNSLALAIVELNSFLAWVYWLKSLWAFWIAAINESFKFFNSSVFATSTFEVASFITASNSALIVGLDSTTTNVALASVIVWFKIFLALLYLLNSLCASRYLLFNSLIASRIAACSSLVKKVLAFSTASSNGFLM
ncbi:hypothetical protein MALH05_00662 [Mycoplasma anatis]|nr:hypothetical protein [Mycoplasmopsis anatis]